MQHQNLTGTRTSELIDQVTSLTKQFVQPLHNFEIIEVHARLNRILAELDARPKDKTAARCMRCRIEMCLIRRAYLRPN